MVGEIKCVLKIFYTRLQLFIGKLLNLIVFRNMDKRWSFGIEILLVLL